MDRYISLNRTFTALAIAASLAVSTTPTSQLAATVDETNSQSDSIISLLQRRANNDALSEAEASESLALRKYFS